MAGLDARGDISIALIIVYLPVLCLALLLTLRHGFGRQAGWIFLLTFSLVRIIGGALHIASEKANPPSTGLFIAAFALESAGIAPLLLCTSSFLGVIAMNSRSPIPFTQTKFMRLLRLAITVALALAIAGASDAGSSNPSDRSTGTTLRRVGAIILIVVYGVIVFIHLIFWKYQDQILLHRKTLLHGISLALPFLGIRVLYSALSSFSPSPSFGPNGITSSNSGLSKFNSISGEWQIFLGMSLIMEFIVVGIYMGFGVLLPLQKETEYQGAALGSPKPEHHQLQTNTSSYAPPQQPPRFQEPYKGQGSYA